MTNIELHSYLTAQAEVNPFLKLEEENISYNTTSPESLEDTHAPYQGDIQSILDNACATHQSLRSHLKEQISLLFSKDKRSKLLGFLLTDYLDDDGYFACPLASIAHELGISVEEIKKFLTQLYKLDPSGVYAVNLTDSLAIQCREKGVFSPEMQLTLNNLELALKYQIKALQKATSLPASVLEQQISLIKTLEPRPGNKFSTPQTQILIPDIFITKHAIENRFIATLNQGKLPEIAFNHSYKSLIQKHRLSAYEQSFCRQNISKAKTLLKAVADRNRTILRVAEVITKIQYEFFSKGLKYLKPMTLREAAQQLNCHESTVSRAGNKVIGTSFGSFPIKYFFSSSISSNLTENTYANKAVQNKIKDIIAHETSTHTLSDEEIRSLLQEQGIMVARRTVSKYREALRIPSSQARRQLKKLSSHPRCLPA